MPKLTTTELISLLKLKPTILDKLSHYLEPVEIHVLCEKYRISHEKTWKEVGDGISLTGERARQIAKKTLRKISHAPLRKIILDETELKISIRN